MYYVKDPSEDMVKERIERTNKIFKKKFSLNCSQEFIYTVEEEVSGTQITVSPPLNDEREALIFVEGLFNGLVSDVTD